VYAPIGLEIHAETPGNRGCYYGRNRECPTRRRRLLSPYGNVSVFDRLVLVRGGGDLGSGVALRLWRAGFPVVILERPNPIAVRRTVSFSEAVYDGEARVEEGEAYRAETLACRYDGTAGVIPVLVDTDAHTACDALLPYAVVDAIMAKRNTGIDTSLAPLVVALGPGFTAGCEVHAVVETNRGRISVGSSGRGTPRPTPGCRLRWQTRAMRECYERLPPGTARTAADPGYPRSRRHCGDGAG
jgi:hypothetical protein